MPSERPAAPVKAPFSCPNSWLSASEGVSAAQLTGTNALFRRGPLRCSSRAQSSLPVPVSPLTSTVHSTSAARSIDLAIRRIRGFEPSTQLVPNIGSATQVEVATSSTMAGSREPPRGFREAASAARKLVGRIDMQRNLSLWSGQPSD